MNEIVQLRSRDCLIQLFDFFDNKGQYRNCEGWKVVCATQRGPLQVCRKVRKWNSFDGYIKKGDFVEENNTHANFIDPVGMEVIFQIHQFGTATIVVMKHISFDPLFLFWSRRLFSGML